MKYSILFFLFLSVTSVSLIAQNDLFNFTVNGNASSIGNQCYELTPADNWASGSIWSGTKIDLNDSFIFEANLLLGCQVSNNDCDVAWDNDGADGIVFALQAVSTSVGSSGEGIGYAGINPSIGVEFDTFFNTELADINVDHLAIFQNGTNNHNSPNNLAGPVPISATNDNVEDCEEHFMRIIWEANSTTLSIFFDCELRLSQSIDIDNIFGVDKSVFWGFTSATGGCNNVHTSCILLPPTLEDSYEYSICNGDSIQINPLQNVSNYDFEWIQTIDLIDASIFNPIANPSTTTTYTLNLIDECNDTKTFDFIVNVQDCDCDNIPNGTAIVDACGVCLSPDSPDFNQSCVDCAGTPNGLFEIDACGVCLSPDSPDFNQSCVDCAGVPNGLFEIDACGVCLSPDNANFASVCEEPLVRVPTAFSPNQDGVNDVLEILLEGEITDYYLAIYNRWGGKVFSSVDSTQHWGGKDEPIGVYMYWLQLSFEDGTTHFSKGTITLIR